MRSLKLSIIMIGLGVGAQAVAAPVIVQPGSTASYLYFPEPSTTAASSGSLDAQAMAEAMQTAQLTVEKDPADLSYTITINGESCGAGCDYMNAAPPAGVIDVETSTNVQFRDIDNNLYPNCMSYSGVTKCRFYLEASGSLYVKTVSPNGGITVEPGMAAALFDENRTAEYGCYNQSTGASSTTNGEYNTSITQSCLPNNSSNAVAAKLCSDKGSGWYLPAKTQLNSLFAQKDLIGGFSPANYWSSTEDNATYAWSQSFSVGSQSNDLKYNLNRVRCVRSY
ncbi:DUF1566 domain-containing protein [Thiomicrorhabdus indica]|uniref:DUF1566 domain-containing protein n=1 Tax=Thiomicrorhabdus indica TaxID=2267253 RepID=UPI00102DB0D6|nr:DUF1566 domain-containing protein [Thiomicrorhabdus indica]